MKKIVFFFAFFMVTNAFAIKVAVVEVQQIFAESKLAKSYQEELEKEFSPRQKILQGKEAETQLKIRDYEKNRLAMSEQEIRATENKIIQLRNDLQQYGQQLQTDFQQAQQKNIRSIEKVINEVIKGIAEKKGFDLVLYQGIAYHKPALNITEEVIKAMEK